MTIKFKTKEIKISIFILFLKDKNRISTLHKELYENFNKIFSNN